MKTIAINPEEFNKLDPKQVIFVCWCGSDDILCQSGDDVIKDAVNDGGLKNPPLYEALNWWNADRSGNSYDIMIFQDGLPCKLSLSALFP